MDLPVIPAASGRHQHRVLLHDGHVHAAVLQACCDQAPAQTTAQNEDLGIDRDHVVRIFVRSALTHPLPNAVMSQDARARRTEFRGTAADDWVRQCDDGGYAHDDHERGRSPPAQRATYAPCHGNAQQEERRLWSLEPPGASEPGGRIHQRHLADDEHHAARDQPQE